MDHTSDKPPINYFEADPLAIVDFDQLASMVGIRLGRNVIGVSTALDEKLLTELARPGQVDDLIVMLSDLGSHAWREEGPSAVQAAKKSYLLGSGLALEVLDSIAFDRRLPLDTYRQSLVGLSDTATRSITYDSHENNPERLLFYIGQAIMQFGDDSYERAEAPLKALVAAVCENDADIILPRPFQAALGVIYSKGRRALVSLAEAKYETIARMSSRSDAQLEAEFAELLRSLD